MSDEIILPIRISRNFVIKHREWYFIYGTDVQNKSTFGQAWHVANEPNSFGVFVLRKVCSNSIFFMDHSPEDFADLNRSIDAIPRDQPIIPIRKVGEGFSQMKYLAPKLFAHMTERLNELRYPNITIDYTRQYE